MKTKIFISLFILFFLGACSLPDSPNKPNDPYQQDEYRFKTYTFRIKGTVTDSIDHSPVVGADVNLRVGLMGYIAGAKTDKDGCYIIEETYILDTLYTNYRDVFLEIRATGHKTKDILYGEEIHVIFTDQWQIIDVQLERESGSSIFSR
jgi:hypothetical protein